MNTLSTHVLDTSLGRPAAGVRIRLERVGVADHTTIGAGTTDANGRLADLVTPQAFTAATYRLRFDVAEYFARTGRSSLFPEVAVIFAVSDGDEHYHIPVLLSPFGYTTYRGS
jgi:5-hydroxyisourate hydrolase